MFSSLRRCIAESAKNGLDSLQPSLFSLSRFSTKLQTEAEKTQELALDNDILFRVDENDRVIGTATKRDCHLVSKDGDIPLHRAFSVYLFNNNGDLLLQKRSRDKITYPNVYTNTCCSHQLYGIPDEDVENDGLGAKKAAQRRLNFELGIPTQELPLEKFTYLTRMYYKELGDGTWGEHEIVYILFFRGDVQVKPNPHEISEVQFVSRNKLDETLPRLGLLTPWFRLISKSKLKFWWDHLDSLDKCKDHRNIVRF